MFEVKQDEGDGSRAGADATQIDTWSDNILAETSIAMAGTVGSPTG